MPLISKLPVLSAKIVGRQIFALVSKNGLLSLILLNESLKTEDKLVTLKGLRGFILDAQKDSCLLAVDDQLISLKFGRLKPILKAHSPTNFFWHAVRIGNSIYVQECGESPTGIWLSTRNYEDWHLLITNAEVDKRSRHFHSIAYDPYRRWVIATLGDGNIVRAAMSDDEGKTWHSLYKGPWQCMPIMPLKDKMVFGMDSGIARGGVSIYYPDSSSWNFVFLKWRNEKVRSAQMCNLKLLSDESWVAALGTPQTIVVSKDLKTWYAAYVEDFDERFNYYMAISEGKEFLACSTGRSLLVLKREELENLMLSAQPVIVCYKAYVDRLKGLGFTAKRIFSSRNCV